MLTLASNYMLIAGAASGVIFSCEELLSRSQWNLLSEKEHSHLRRTRACETKQSASMPLHPHPQQNANRKRITGNPSNGVPYKGLYGITAFSNWVSDPEPPWATTLSKSKSRLGPPSVRGRLREVPLYSSVWRMRLRFQMYRWQNDSGQVIQGTGLKVFAPTLIALKEKHLTHLGLYLIRFLPMPKL